MKKEIKAVGCLNGSSWKVGELIHETCKVESIHHMKSLGIVRVNYTDGAHIEIPWHAVAFLRWSAE